MPANGEFRQIVKGLYQKQALCQVAKSRRAMYMKDLIFEPYDAELGKLADAHKPVMQKANRQSLDLLLGRANKLIVRQRGGEKFTDDDFALINEIVTFCRSPFRDEQNTGLALDFLMELYDPLITKAVKKACEICGLLNELEDWKGSGQVVFRRLVTGDLPQSILAYEKHKIGRPERTIGLEIDVSEKRIPFLKAKRVRELDENLKQLINLGLPEQDLEIAKMVLEDSKNNFHESATFSSSEVSLFEFVNDILHHEMEISKRLSTNASTKEKRKEFSLKASILGTQILTSSESLQKFIDGHHGYFNALHKQYLKTAYRNKFFKKERGRNFTTYMTKFLPLRLIDIFKSGAGRKSRNESGKSISIDAEGFVEKASFKTDQMLSFFEDNPYDFVLVQSKVTPKQWEILGLCMEGYSQKEIAERFKVSQACISKHMKDIRTRLTGTFSG